MESFDSILDKIYDEDNNDIIVLQSEKGENIPCEQIAVVPLDNGEIYVILKLVTPLEGMADDEALVFEIKQEQERLELVLDDEIIDRVFDIYNSLVEAEDNE